jgi:hypothetical protein
MPSHTLQSDVQFYVSIKFPLFAQHIEIETAPADSPVILLASP